MGSTFKNLVKVRSNTTGTGALVLGDAVAGFYGVERLVDGAQYSYALFNGAGAESGRGVFDLDTLTLTRAAVLDSTNDDDPLDLAGSSTVIVGTLLDADLDELRRGTPPAIYNYSTAHLSRWLAARDDPAERAVACWSGTSLFTGQGAGVLANSIDDARVRCVPAFAAQTLEALGFPARHTAMSGFLGGSEALFEAYDTRVEFDAAQWASTGDVTTINGLLTQQSPNTGAFTWNLTSTDDRLRLVLVTEPGNGVLAVSVDGSPAGTFDTDAANGLLTPTINLGAPGAHVITFARSSGGKVAIAYAETWNSTDPEACMLNCAAGSRTVTARTSVATPWTIRNVIKALAPHLVMFNAGFTSILLGDGSAAAVKAMIGPYIDELKASDIDVILVVESPGALSLNPAYVWTPADDIAIEPYRQAMYELALEKGCVLIDFITAFGGHQQLRSQGLFQPFLTNQGLPDEVHGSETLYGAQGKLCGEVLAR